MEACALADSMLSSHAGLFAMAYKLDGLVAIHEKTNRMFVHQGVVDLMDDLTGSIVRFTWIPELGDLKHHRIKSQSTHTKRMKPVIQFSEKVVKPFDKINDITIMYHQHQVSRAVKQGHRMRIKHLFSFQSQYQLVFGRLDKRQTQNMLRCALVMRDKTTKEHYLLHVMIQDEYQEIYNTSTAKRRRKI